MSCLRLVSIYNCTIAHERKYREWKKNTEERRNAMETLFCRKFTDNEFMNLCNAVDSSSTLRLLEHIDASSDYIVRRNMFTRFTPPMLTTVDNLSTLTNRSTPEGTVIYCLDDNCFYISHDGEHIDFNSHNII